MLTALRVTPFSQRVRTETKRWSWLWLVTGILWMVVSVLILQFNAASAATVGAIAGFMLIYAGFEYFVFGSFAAKPRWIWYVFGGFLVTGGLVALIYPTRTFLAIASILGFMLVFAGIMGIIEAFIARPVYDLWWLNLIAGILTLVLGFWMSGQYLMTQAASLLLFAGAWAMMRGFLAITAFFTMRGVADTIPATADELPSS